MLNKTFKLSQSISWRLDFLRRYCASIGKSETDDNSKILSTMNNSTESELINLGISRARSEQIIRWRSKNGTFQNLEQMLQINGFGTKILEKVTNKILNPVINTKNKNDIEQIKPDRTGKQYTIPSFSEHLRPQLKSCLSLHIAVSSISWSRFQLNSKGPCLLTDWNHCNIVDKKMHINDLVKECSMIIDKIPEADCYVLENPKIAQMSQPGSPAQININVQKSQLIGIISYALSRRNYCLEDENNESKKFSPNLFYLKKYLYSRLFDTLVGSESVSTTQALLELMRTHYNIEDMPSEIDDYDMIEIKNIRGKVSMPMNFREEYEKWEGVQREFLGQTILIGLTFIRLCILKCPNSIRKINPNLKIAET